MNTELQLTARGIHYDRKKHTSDDSWCILATDKTSVSKFTSWTTLVMCYSHLWYAYISVMVIEQEIVFDIQHQLKKKWLAPWGSGVG